MRALKEAIIHSSATRARTDIGVLEIRSWHINDNGWSDIGYHFVITRDGGIQEGRPLRLAGAHVSGRNSNTIGICMVGGVKEDGRTPEKNFTHAQWNSLALLIGDLLGDFPGLAIHGHREFAATACPSFDVQEWAQNIEPICDGMGLNYDPTEPYHPDDYLEPSSLLSSFFVWLRGLFRGGAA